MKTNLKHITLGLALLSGSSLLAQWNGPANTTGDIYRSGKVSIGTTAAASNIQLEVFSTDVFGTTATNNIQISAFGGAGGSSGSNIINRTWLLRKTNGSTWTTAAIHDGIEANGSATPGTSSKTWWERHPSDGTQKWGHNSSLFMELSNAGALYIGTQRPIGVAAGSMLSVDGYILTKGLRVANSNTYWADFVFEQDYKLMPLAEVEKYIRANKHLPEVPSEAEVKKDGVDMYDMNVKLLQKVEELYLHTIALQKQVNEQKQELEKLKSK